MLNKKRVEKLAKLLSQMTKFPSKIIVLVSYNMRDNI